MSSVLVVATAGAGGDLQPLMAATLALRERGHEVTFLGDRAVARVATAAGCPAQPLPPDVDLGPALVAAIGEAMIATGGDVVAAGPIVQRRLSEWAARAAKPVRDAVARGSPDVVVTSLFGIEVVAIAARSCPWAVVNSTFYVGPNPPRSLEEDFAPRAVPLISRFASLTETPSLMLHGTDRAFDLGFDGLPPRHHYVGPLGVWEPPTDPPAYLDEPGDPWVLVSISSQVQDDVPMAEAALAALADRPVRVVVTLGPGHSPDELSVVPPNAHVERTVSHDAVLARGALLVSHAGHGSVMKALWRGRPMVLVPWGRDQPGVAARAARLGVAEVVPRGDANAGTLAHAIDRVLGDQRMRERAASHAARLSTTNPPGEAARLIESLL